MELGAETMNLDKYLEGLKNCGFEITCLPNKIIIERSDITIIGTSENAIWTTYGVFCEEQYGFTALDDFVVFDIGLNIGASALYFSQQDNIKKVYGFEPFQETYKLAMMNLEMNKELSNKIEPFNFGLGAQSKEVSVSYNASLPGSMSTTIDRFSGSGFLERVTIKDVAEVMSPLLHSHQEKILVKIDCEGGEFEILPRLEASGLLSQIDAIVMEWHFTPPQGLIEILRRNNFLTFHSHVVINELGLIYAIKK